MIRQVLAISYNDRVSEHEVEPTDPEDMVHEPAVHNCVSVSKLSIQYKHSTRLFTSIFSQVKMLR